MASERNTILDFETAIAAKLSAENPANDTLEIPCPSCQIGKIQTTVKEGARICTAQCSRFENDGCDFRRNIAC